MANVDRKEYTRRLSGMCLTGAWGIVIDPERYMLAFEEFTLRELKRDRDDSWCDEIPDGNGHGIDTVRYAMAEGVMSERGRAVLPCDVLGR